MKLKFKLFHKSLNKMYFLNGFVQYGEGWNGGNPEYKFYEVYFGGSGFMKVQASEVEILQFTGLIDKGDREIYRGDIVKARGYNVMDTFRNYEVIYDETKAEYVFKDIQGHSYSDNSVGHYKERPCTLHTMEVIGNIFEHPSLLTALIKNRK